MNDQYARLIDGIDFTKGHRAHHARATQEKQEERKKKRGEGGRGLQRNREYNTQA